MKLRRARSAAPGAGGSAADRGSGSGGSSRLRRSWPQRLIIAVNIVLVIVCLGSAWALGFYNNQFSKIPKIPLQGVLDVQADPTKPQNFLLVGVDNAEGLDPNDAVLRGRDAHQNLSDSIMILRVDPNQKEAALLSLPRDLLVTLPGGRGKDRINTAMAYDNGKPDLLIQTIKSNFGIEINHYMQVNFAAFRSLVDALGGVNIWFDNPARDPNTGLAVGAKGCQVLDGKQALAYARSRHYEAQIDGKWAKDPSSDIGRVQRQQYFIKQAARAAIARGARNPIELGNLIGIAQQFMKIDDALSPQQIIDLADKFNTFDPDDLQQYTPPVRGGTWGAASVLFLEDAGAQPMFDIFRGKNALFDVNAAMRVEVRNGTGRAGQAKQVADDLAGRGFTITAVNDDRTPREERTVITYAPGDPFRKAAVVVGRYFDGTPTFEEDAALAGTSTYVSVTVGQDFAGLRREPRPVEDFAEVVGSANPSAPVGSTAPATTPGSSPPTTAAPSLQDSAFIPHPDPNIPC